MVAFKSQSSVVRYVPYGPLTREDVLERVRTVWSRTELTEPGQSMTLAVEERDTGILVGDVVLFWHSAQHRTGEIGYILAPEATGKGYATEAGKALLRLGFDDLGLHRIRAAIDERNERSARVLERLGMRREGRLVEDTWCKGEWVTTLTYAILDREWRADHS